MSGTSKTRLQCEFELVDAVLSSTPNIDPLKCISTAEYIQRQSRVWDSLQKLGFDCGFVFSDEHYCGDVPYLGGNTNITVEQIAGVIGANGFHFIAGLEGGYVVEQLAPRSGSRVHKVEMLQLAGEDYPIKGERPEAVFEIACGYKPKRIALLSPREVVPIGIAEFIETAFGERSLIDAQNAYQQIKYEKSDEEMMMAKDASIIADSMMVAMLAVLKPGMLETQVAAWGHFVARELGAEELGWDIMVTANTANRSLIGKALNRRIKRGDMVHLGVSPKRDGVTSCIRRSVIALDKGEKPQGGSNYWIDVVIEAYRVGYDAFILASERNSPAGTIEKSIVDFLRSKNDEVSKRLGKTVDLVQQKPYSCIHNTGYTECQEFYGAVTLGTSSPLGNQIVNMLDVALRGCGDTWDQVIIPDMDFVVVENTLGKSGAHVECLNHLPEDCQILVGGGGL